MYHPDVNPGNQQAQDKFIEVTAAYKFLLATKAPPPPTKLVENSSSTTVRPTATKTQSEPVFRVQSSQTEVKVVRKDPPIQFNPDLSPMEQQMKRDSYAQLQTLLKQHRFPRAIALVEGLVRRIPQDPEIIQWQAIVYQRWGRQLIRDRQLDKARLYLKKALRTDPHNRSLWAEVEKDFRQIEHLF